MRFIANLPWSLVIVGCLTLGLAPFFPPHIAEKLAMLARSELVRPIDWFDLLYHSIPWMLLAAKIAASIMQRRSA